MNDYMSEINAISIGHCYRLIRAQTHVSMLNDYIRTSLKFAMFKFCKPNKIIIGGKAKMEITNYMQCRPISEM